MQRNLARDFVVAAAFAAASLSIASALAGAAVPGDSPAAPRLISTADEPAKPGCFFRRNWLGGWRASPDARSIYINVSGAVYRLDLTGSYSLLKDPFAVLINRGSSDTICTPLDFRLTVSNRVGGLQSPIVKRITQLTPEEAKALPKKLQP
jgi:hypothetical protein